MMDAAEGQCGAGRVGRDPIRREKSLSGTAKGDDLGSVGECLGKKISPCAHQAAPLIEQMPRPKPSRANLTLGFSAQWHHVWGREAIRYDDGQMSRPPL
jgi:hypothetical protein